MKFLLYILREYFEANPDFKHTKFFTWEEACEEFGEDMAQFNWGKNGENSPNKADGLECRPWEDGTVRDDLIQEFSIIELDKSTYERMVNI